MPPKLHQLQSVAAHEGKINSMCLGHRTAQIFATGGEDRFLRIWSIGSNNPRSSFGPFQSLITACKFNPNEEMIVCANNSGTVMLFDLNENLCSSNWTSHRSTVRSLSFHSQDPRLILTCGIDGKFNVLSTTQRMPIQSYAVHNGPVNYVTCSSDGKYAATCGDDKTIRIFDLTAQKQLIKFDGGHTDAITCVEFHPTEPLLISCGVDKSVRFWDMQNQREIPVSFPIDSSPVDVVMFAPFSTPTTYDVALSASADYIKTIGWRPSEMYDCFSIGLECVHDIAVDNSSGDEGTLTIASSSGETALIHRMLLNQIKPFSSRQPQASKLDSNTSESEKPKSSTPRLLDITTMAKVKPKSKAAPSATTNTKTTTAAKRSKANVTPSSSTGNSSLHPKTKTSSNASRVSGRSTGSSRSNRSVSSDTKKSDNDNDSEASEKRSNSSGSRNSKNSNSSAGSKRFGTKSSYSTENSEELKIFKDFRKYRGSFITQMNERYARLTRVKDSLAQIGLTKTLENAAETGELGAELLVILGMKPGVVKLEHAALMMQISVKVFDRDYDLAITTVESMLQAYGKLVNVTRQTSLNGVGNDIALEERKKKSDLFVESFREIAPKMRTVACGKSPISQTAAEILEDWKFFLR